MNHLQAYLSAAGAAGRIWFDEEGQYMRRANGDYMHRADRHDEWEALREQVASVNRRAEWLKEEIKTLTPQDALRALADGETIARGDGNLKIRLSSQAGCLIWKDPRDLFPGCGNLDLIDFHVFVESDKDGGDDGA